jgi:D-arabinose 1-dehydrogenase-like Zn-dependent alcohol dehydrogenase
MGGLEQYCAEDSVFTYGGVDRDGSENTHGGYSKSIVAHRDKVTGYFDFILDTFSATHDLGFYLRMLKTNG